MLVATGAQPYRVITPAAERPIDVATLKQWLKITSDSEDAILQLIINGVVDAAECWTKRDFIIKTYRTYRDVFGDIGDSPSYQGYPARHLGVHHYKNEMPITIRRSPFSALVSLTYKKDGVDTPIDNADIQTIVKNEWSKLVPAPGKDWPSPDQVPQAITINFTAGYGATAGDVPDDIRVALLQHAASVYSNRGDCDDGSSCDCSCAAAPASAMAIYNKYRILDFVA